MRRRRRETDPICTRVEPLAAQRSVEAQAQRAQHPRHSQKSGEEVQGLRPHHAHSPCPSVLGAALPRKHARPSAPSSPTSSGRASRCRRRLRTVPRLLSLPSTHARNRSWERRGRRHAPSVGGVFARSWWTRRTLTTCRAMSSSSSCWTPPRTTRTPTTRTASLTMSSDGPDGSHVDEDDDSLDGELGQRARIAPQSLKASRAVGMSCRSGGEAIARSFARCSRSTS